MVLILTATFCWAVAQIIGKIALKGIETTLFNAIRFSAVIPFLLLGVFLTGGWSSAGLSVPLLAAILSGAIGMFCGCQLFFYLMKRGAAHRVIPTANSHPFWTIFLAVFLLGEEIKIFLPVSAVLIFLGSFLIAVRRKTERGSKYWRWEIPLACFVGFLWGLSTILSKYCLNEGMAISALLLVEVVAAATSFGFAATAGGFWKNSKNLRWSTGLSVLSGAMGLLIGEQIYLLALQIETASTLGPLMGGTILFGFLLSIFLLKERTTKKAILGTAFILGGVFLIMI